MKKLDWYKVNINPWPFGTISIFERHLSKIFRERIEIRRSVSLFRTNKILVRHIKQQLIKESSTAKTYKIIYDNIVYFETVQDAEDHFDINGDGSIIENITDIIND